jgi:hypothetical protein
MKLLKIGSLWINPELISEIKDECDNGADECALTVRMNAQKFYVYEEEYAQAVYTFGGEEREALLHWLADNSDDVLAADCGKDSRTITRAVDAPLVGKRVRVVNGSGHGDRPYINRVGIAYDPINSIVEGGEIIYIVRFDGGDSREFYGRELEPMTDNPSVVDEATSDPHFCDAPECEQPAAHQDYTGRWYCYAHWIPF